MTDHRDLKTVGDCRAMQEHLQHALLGAEEVERVSKEDAYDAMRAANKVRGDMSRLRLRMQKVCLHPIADVKVATTFGFVIATCTVCNKMLETRREVL